VLESLKSKLRLAANFPSPPAIALQIVALAADPDIDTGRVGATISKDPGLSAKVLRVANSPLYSKRRKSENLRQALVALGLNAATTLALSFSLVASYKTPASGKPAAAGKSATGGKTAARRKAAAEGNPSAEGGFDYARYWRRAILSASAARTFATLKGSRAPENIFLAGLLQDIGMLGIARVEPDVYRALPAEASHAETVALERRVLGTDHAALGGWLLRHWKLPESLCATVEASHDPCAAAAPLDLPARCVALASECVELLLAQQGAPDLEPLAALARSWLDLDPQSLTAAMSTIVAEIPEIERLFETPILEGEAATLILEQARELLTLRNLQAIDQVTVLRQTAEHLEARTTELEDKHRRDGLTGVFNRRYLDEILDREFAAAKAGQWPLSLVFADLDRFKLVNDTHGHPAGDAVLINTARMFLAAVRDSDFVARYGGEEFMIVLPGLAADGAVVVCERVLNRLRDLRHPVAGGSIRVTASLGLATQDTCTPFERVSDLIEAADRCVYAAKKAGRDRMVRFNPAGMFQAALG
jgi:diguanylate cyclase (GGDEF)-like protein